MPEIPAGLVIGYLRLHARVVMQFPECGRGITGLPKTHEVLF